MSRQWWIVALLGLVVVGGLFAWVLAGGTSPADEEGVPVEVLANGLELDWQADGPVELRAEVCWAQEADPAIGECPFTLVRSPVESPLSLALHEFDCPKCPEVDADQLWAFLEEGVRDAAGTKLYRWELTWTVVQEEDPVARVVNPLVPSDGAPPGDPSLTNPLLPDAGS